MPNVHSAPAAASAASAAHGADATDVRSKPSAVRRVANIVVVLVVVVLLPALVADAIAGEAGVGALLVGLTLGLVGSKLSGVRRMAYLVPGIGITAGLGASAAFGWWWVALVAVTGAIAGAGIASGYVALLMVPFAATFVSPAP